MAWSYESLITELHIRHDYAQTHLAWARIHYNSGKGAWDSGDDHTAIGKALDALYANNQACEDIIHGGYFGYNGSTNIIPTIFDLLEPSEPPEEYELTYQKIIEAWAKNDFEGAGATIAFIDRMRQIIWNEPFYVAWAARPEQQDL